MKHAYEGMPAETQIPALLPVVEQWAVSAEMIGDEQATVVRCFGPSGVSVHYLTRETALSLASMMRKQAQSGIDVPSGLVVPR